MDPNWYFKTGDHSPTLKPDSGENAAILEQIQHILEYLENRPGDKYISIVTPQGGMALLASTGAVSSVMVWRLRDNNASPLGPRMWVVQYIASVGHS